VASVLPSRRPAPVGRTRNARRTTTAALALAALLLAGCSALSPITTAYPYNPSDGVRVELGSTLKAENLLVISAAKDKPGALVGGLTNLGTADARVTLAPQGASKATVRVPAGGTVLLGSDLDPPIELDTVSVPPGALLPVTISTPDGGSEQVSVPVLDGTLPQYATLVPSPDATG